MKKKSLIISILLFFVVILSLSVSFAEDTSDLNETVLQESNDIETISQSDNEVISQSDEASEIIENSQEIDDLLTKEETVNAGSNNSVIQDKINGLSDGDVLNFENGTYTDICLIVDKSITINGNGATLIGYDTPSKSNTPSQIYNTSAEGGYGISNFATLFIVNTHNVTLNGLTFIGRANSGANTADALIFAKNVPGIIINNSTFDGSCTGIYLSTGCHDGTITNNIIKNQESTGILNFQSARTLIERNYVLNAKNHGIDARHSVGPNVQVINNTVIGSKEGIYFMHSPGHIAANNTLINCTLSSITCYGAQNIKIYNNKLKQSRIGVLLAGIYTNIDIGENEFELYDLPLPPIFAYYVAEAKQEYQDEESIMGTHTDLVKSDITYKEFSELEVPGPIVIDYDKILNKTGEIKYVTAGMTNSEIQSLIDSMANGDILSFEANAEFYNICIYTDKNIKIIGNNATLYGYETSNLTYVPEKIRNTTADNGYGISDKAVIYSVRNANVVISDLNIICRYPDHGLVKPPANPNYRTSGIYAQRSENITITNCRIDGGSFGIFLHFQTNVAGCSNAIVSNNYVSNQFTYGIINFGSDNSKIINNTVVNARFHGIDVRHEFGPNVTVFNNTVIGSQEGIYLMHSKGHYVYGNTIINSKVSSISAYGSGNEYIFNNTLQGSRIGIIIGGEHYNVTIGENTYILDTQKSGDKPGFGEYLVEAKRIYDVEDIVSTYTDQKTVFIEADSNIGYSKTMTITLTDENNGKVANVYGTVSINNKTYEFKTDENGAASVKLDVDLGNYENVVIKSISNTYYTSGYLLLTNVNITDDRVATEITVAKQSFNMDVISKGASYKVTLKDANGNAVANKEISIKLDSKTFKATTNDKGIATFTLTCANSGTKTATLEFAGDDSYFASNNATVIKINKVKTAITASGKNVYVQAIASGYKYSVTLKDASGKALANKQITVNFNNKNYKATTNSKGVATVTLKASASGTKKAVIKFGGDTVYVASSKTVNIKISKEASKLTAAKKTFKVKAKNKKYAVTLKSKSGKVISKVKVAIKVNSKKYTATTNAKGKATFKITKLTKKGSHTAKISFAGNKYFNKISKSVKITVKK